MEFTAENIEKAILQFYHDSNNRHAIHQWLTTAQVAPQAWTFCWELLKPGKGQEVQFFGASSLYVKISRYWHEVPEEQIITLRTQLLEQIACYATGPKMILTRLCVVLASLTLQTMPTAWPTAVVDIMSSFQQANLPHLSSTQVCVVLLEIMTVLPEEFVTSHLIQHRRGIVRNELRKALAHVLPLLHGVMQETSPIPVYEQALRCFSSWVQFGIPLMDSQQLVVTTFSALQNQQLFDSAIEALVQVFSHQDNCRYPSCMQRLLPHILQLEPHLQAAIQEKDSDLCQSLVRLIVCAADNSSKLLLQLTNEDEQQRSLAISMVKLVLECTAIPGHYPVDENCSDMSFGFWYNLQDDIVASEPDIYAVLGQIYIPSYMNLVDVLLQKAQYPQDDEYNSWNNDEKEQHRCYRQDISDTLMYAHNLLQNLILVSLVRLFESIIERSSTQTVAWQEVESVLFAVTALAENIDVEEDVCLPALFNMFSRIPCNNDKLVSQALYLIGSYAEWISAHPEVLGSIIPLLLQGLQDPSLAQSATLSLKEVVRENQSNLLPYVTPILKASKQVLDGEVLKPRDTIRLMACLGYVFSVLPIDTIMGDLNVILSPHIEKLQSVAMEAPSAANKSTILVKLNMLCWLFGSLDTKWREDEEGEGTKSVIPANSNSDHHPQPTMLVLKQTLPVISQVVQTWVSDVTIVEAVAEMLKKALRTLMDDFAPLATDVSQLIANMYNACPQPALLDVSKQLMMLFASDINNEMYQMTGSFLFNALCSRTLVLFESGVREHPDLVDSFMAFLSQVVRKYPKVLGSEGCNCLGLFRAGSVALGMPETPTVKSACSFLIEFMNSGDKIPYIRAIVEGDGQAIVERLMKAIGGESPRAVVDSMADVFLALNKNYFPNLCQWMNAVVAQENFPTPKATQQAKEQFARRVLRERANKRILRETVQEYTLLWRGLLGTEYGAQTSSIMERGN